MEYGDKGLLTISVDGLNKSIKYLNISFTQLELNNLLLALAKEDIKTHAARLLNQAALNNSNFTAKMSNAILEISKNETNDEVRKLLNQLLNNLNIEIDYLSIEDDKDIFAQLKILEHNVKHGFKLTELELNTLANVEENAKEFAAKILYQALSYGQKIPGEIVIALAKYTEIIDVLDKILNHNYALPIFEYYIQEAEKQLEVDTNKTLAALIKVVDKGFKLKAETIEILANLITHNNFSNKVLQILKILAIKGLYEANEVFLDALFKKIPPCFIVEPGLKLKLEAIKDDKSKLVYYLDILSSFEVAHQLSKEFWDNLPVEAWIKEALLMELLYGFSDQFEIDKFKNKLSELEKNKNYKLFSYERDSVLKLLINLKSNYNYELAEINIFLEMFIYSDFIEILNYGTSILKRAENAWLLGKLEKHFPESLLSAEIIKEIASNIKKFDFHIKYQIFDNIKNFASIKDLKDFLGFLIKYQITREDLAVNE